MTQTSNRIFDEMARLMNDAAGVAQGVRREFDTLFRSQAERILRDLDVVQREDFEAVKEMARLAREENEALKARIAALEDRTQLLAVADPIPLRTFVSGRGQLQQGFRWHRHFFFICRHARKEARLFALGPRTQLVHQCGSGGAAKRDSPARAQINLHW